MSIFCMSALLPNKRRCSVFLSVLLPNKRSVFVFLSVLLPNTAERNAESARIREFCWVGGSCADYGPDHKSPLTILLRLTHTVPAEALGAIRNQVIEPIATAPLSAVMTRSSQEIRSILLLDVCETAAASEFAGAIVSMLPAVTMVAAGDGASVAGAPCVLAGSMPLVWSGEATRTVPPSITRPLGGC